MSGNDNRAVRRNPHMSGAARSGSGGWRRWRRWRRDQRGTTLLEFAILAPVFFVFVLLSFQVALAYFAASSIENATADAARLIRTGQAQGLGFDKARFKQEVCSRTISFITDCQAKLRVDARTVTTFAQIQAPKCLSSNGSLQAESNFGFDPGGAESIVLVTVCYELDIFAGLPDFGFANTRNGNFLIRASASFRNEPYS